VAILYPVGPFDEDGTSMAGIVLAFASEADLILLAASPGASASPPSSR